MGGDSVEPVGPEVVHCGARYGGGAGGLEGVRGLLEAEKAFVGGRILQSAGKSSGCCFVEGDSARWLWPGVYGPRERKGNEPDERYVGVI